MSLPVIIRPAARDDLDAAYEWYESQQPGRGDEFLTEFRERVEEVRQAPEQFGRAHGSIRAASLHRSRYVIYYRITPDEVTVIAVQHARANPRMWQRRK